MLSLACYLMVSKKHALAFLAGCALADASVVCSACIVYSTAATAALVARIAALQCTWASSLQ